MRVADDPAGFDPIKRLQIGDRLFEDIKAARAVQLADVRRHDGATLPTERDSCLHVPTDGKRRLRKVTRQLDFKRRHAAADAKRTWPSANHP